LRGAFGFVNAGGGCGDLDLLPEELSFISLFSLDLFQRMPLFRLVVCPP
jgi:hypothetical protein